jgi:hypothetical protein
MDAQGVTLCLSWPSVNATDVSQNMLKVGLTKCAKTTFSFMTSPGLGAKLAMPFDLGHPRLLKPGKRRNLQGTAEGARFTKGVDHRDGKRRRITLKFPFFRVAGYLNSLI